MISVLFVINDQLALDCLCLNDQLTLGWQCLDVQCAIQRYIMI